MYTTRQIDEADTENPALGMAMREMNRTELNYQNARAAMLKAEIEYREATRELTMIQMAARYLPMLKAAEALLTMIEERDLIPLEEDDPAVIKVAVDLALAIKAIEGN